MRALLTACLMLAGCWAAAAEPLKGMFAPEPPAGADPTFQIYRFNVCGTGDSGVLHVCQIDFVGIARKAKTKITNASCFVQMNRSEELEYIQMLLLNNKEEVVTAQTLEPSLTSKVGNVATELRSNYSANDQITAFVQPKQIVRMLIGTTGEQKGATVSVYCHVSGS